MNKGKDIVNFVTCNEEVVSGTLDAAGGQFFSGLEPIPGYTDYITGDVNIGDGLLGLKEGVETVAVPARAPSGEVVDSKPIVQEGLDKCKAEGKIPVVHSVYGSKTGIA